ncbi:hypothetical protein A2U01_0096248, partial [Trifolium medium]|nr:hypothetical protein [Trifolium medium]
TGIPEPRRGYPIPDGYGFGVIFFIPDWNWDGFGETRTLWVWVWGGQNPPPPRLIAMPSFWCIVLQACTRSQEKEAG